MYRYGHQLLKMSAITPINQALEPMLSAINALKAEVDGLASKLHSVEERVLCLEQATYTPSSSNNGSPVLPQGSNRILSTNPAEQFMSQLVMQKAGESTRTTNDHHKPESKEGTLIDTEYINLRTSDLRHHLKPIIDGMEMLNKHLFKLEDLIVRQNLKICLRSPPSSQKVKIEGFQPPPNTTQQSPNPRGAFAEKLRPHARPRNVTNTFPEPTRHIFGQPSTPNRRHSSLNMNGSPFSSYVDDRSPFTQLASRKPSVLGLKLDVPSSELQPRIYRSRSNFGVASSFPRRSS